MARQPSEPVAVVGAGPYGLSVAAHLRDAGIEAHVFGDVMRFWCEQMPAGMLLRSRRRSSHIAAPRERLKLTDFARSRRAKLATPITRDEFVEYGHWFQHQAVPEIDERHVQRIDAGSSTGTCFKLLLDDGETYLARRVVIAAGVGPFAWQPPVFDGLPADLVSHTSDHQGFARFRGQRVVVVGGGQSALESAALLHESGAEVEVLARAPHIRWLGKLVGGPKQEKEEGPVCPIITPPPTDVGGRVLGWIVAAPDIYRRVPTPLRPYFKRTYGPAGAGWLRARLTRVRITLGRTVTGAVSCDRQARLALDDGTDRRADHVILGTGYRVDVARYGFLAPELVHRLKLVDGYPRLSPGLESAVPGLHFVGAPAAMSFGPIMRFVVGTWYAAPAVTRRMLGRRQPLVSLAFPRTPA